MPLYIVSLIVGFAVITWSADRFVLGASVTARRLGVSALVIGLTVVGLGTSAPELLVSGMAAWQGNTGIAVGNAIGSNIANVGLILGLTALVYPLLVRSRILRRELPLLLVVMGGTVLLLLDLFLGRMEGVVLMLGLGAMLLWMARLGSRQDAPSDMMGLEIADEIPDDMPLTRALLLLAVGLALLLASSRLLVWAAVGIAQTLGVSDLVIGLSIVALGTSLPELATCVASARKGEHDIAIGNVIGSNMFNLLGVMGFAGAIAPYHMDGQTLYRDFPVMAALTVAFFVMAYGFGRQGRINRFEGGVLIVAYTAYQVTVYIGARP